MKLFAKTAASVLMLVSLYTQSAFSQNRSPVTENNKEIVKQAFTRWSNGKGNFFDLLTDDVQWTITGSMYLSKTYTSKKQFLDEVINPLNDRLSKRIVTKLTGLYADGDMVIALWDGVATATDGKPYNASYSWNMEMKDGKIFKVVAFLWGFIPTMPG